MNFIDDLGASIVVFFNGGATIGSELLKYENFRGKSQSVRLKSKKICVKTNK